MFLLIYIYVFKVAQKCLDKYAQLKIHDLLTFTTIPKYNKKWVP